MLSTTVEYAIRALLFLARVESGQVVCADEIAEATGAPRNYMSKTLNALAKAGILSSARGPLGGFALAVSPFTLTIAQIVELFDEPRPWSRCLLGAGPCDPNRPCAAHHRWTAIAAARRAPLATTIAELAGISPFINTAPAA